MKRTAYRACNLCEAICGLEIQIENEKIVSVRGDAADVFSRGHICPKGVEIGAIQNDPDRLRFPMKRTGSQWTQISWDEALNECAEQLYAVQQKHGTDAVAYYAGNPNVHNYGSSLFGQRFMARLKTKNYYTATSVDQLPHHFAAFFMYGHPLLVPVPDIDRTMYFLILGANPIASNGSMMTAPDMRGRMKGIRDRGGRIVTVDPRRTETAEKSTEHLFIKPGTDAFFLLSLLHVIFQSPMKASKAAALVDGLDHVKKLSADFSPAQTAAITGIRAEDTTRIAQEFLAAPSAVCYGRVGLSTQKYGGLCQWLIQVINIVSGNLDKEGGAMFTHPAVDLIGQEGKRDAYGSFASYRTQVRNLPEFGGELPVSALADEILHPGGVRALVTSAGNPVLSTPNGTRLEEALRSLEFMACVDFYINETTRHANIILPPTAPLEHDHYDIVFHVLAVRNTSRYSEPVFTPAEGTMHDWEIFSELARRLEDARSGGAKKSKDSRNKMSPAVYLERMLKSGPHSDTVTLDGLRKAPHGIDLGPLQPALPDRLRTSDKRIQLDPGVFVEDLKRLRKEAQAGNSEGLLLIGRRTLRDNNSWMHNAPGLMKGKNRCTLLLNPDDAAQLSVADGEIVTVKSRTGQVKIPAEISSSMMRGVVSIPHGYGHNRSGSVLSVASDHAGASINDITDEKEIDELTGNAAFSGVRVTVTK